jgi:hypothetical protein
MRGFIDTYQHQWCLLFDLNARGRGIDELNNLSQQLILQEAQPCCGRNQGYLMEWTEKTAKMLL